MRQTCQEIEISFVSWRLKLLYSSVLFAIFVLFFRLFFLHIISHEKLVHEGDMRSLRIQQIPTSRGIISDRFGRVLAASIPVQAIWIDPQEIKNKGGITNETRWKALADVLKIPLNKLNSYLNVNSKVRFVYLARHVNQTISDYITQLKLPGVYLRQESRRYYPSRQTTAHLTGITDIDNQGIEGVEKSFDQWLTGQPGKRLVRQDLFGRVVETKLLTESKPGHNVILSIDQKLQSLVYRELNNAVTLNKAKSGTAVLVDINTSEILAMANSPSYNPNNIAHTTMDIMRNHAITDVLEPGSTVKPMVVVTALQRGIINENSVINTAPYSIQGHKIQDVVPYDELNITEILQKSSNIGISKLALSMPSTALLETYSNFGLGQKTNVELVGENSGSCFQNKILSKMEQAAFSYGYGLMVTPLQLARVYTTLGSLGILRPFSITKVEQPVTSTRIYPESLLRKVTHMMESVALPGGGGFKAAIKGFRVAIKTGTAKKVGANKKYVNKYIAYTAGFAPASNPRFALVIVINDPTGGEYYGGAVSAPVFSSIMNVVLRTMNIVPDNLKPNDDAVHYMKYCKNTLSQVPSE